MVLPLWRSLHSLNLMLPKEDRGAMLLRLYNETGPITNHSQDRLVPKENDVNGDDATLAQVNGEMQGDVESDEDIEDKENVDTQDISMGDEVGVAIKAPLETNAEQ